MKKVYNAPSTKSSQIRVASSGSCGHYTRNVCGPVNHSQK